MVDFNHNPNHKNSRVFEHGINPCEKIEKNKDGARKYYYKTLMKISLKHSFYNGNNARCPDFDVFPTYSSAKLMRSLGLLFKKTETGLSILYNEKNKSSLFNFLEKNNVKICENGVKEYWSRLSFIATVTNPLFNNFTDISIDTKPSINNFYLSNLQAHLDEDGNVILNKDEFINQLTQDYFDVVSTQHEVDFEGSIRIEVRDVSGEIVICLPNKIPKLLARTEPSEALTCCKVENYIKEYCDGDCEKCIDKCFKRESVYINFSSFPEGVYTICWIYNDKKSRFKNVIYTVSFPSPMCFINLFFSRPKQTSSGIFPVLLESGVDESKVTSVEYQMWFNQRSSYWIYWVVPKTTLSENLSILTEKNQLDKVKQITFDGPYKGKLVTGQAAYWFVSNDPLELQQIPEYRFKLIEQLDGLDIRELANPLPVASNKQLVSKNYLNKGGLSQKLLNKVSSELNLSSKNVKPPKYSEIYVYV